MTSPVPHLRRDDHAFVQPLPDRRQAGSNTRGAMDFARNLDRATIPIVKLLPADGTIQIENPPQSTGPLTIGTIQFSR